MKPLLHIMLLLALAALGSLARAAPFALPGSQVFSLPDPVTDTPYEVIVTLPGGYDPKAAKPYPVFYYLDAYWDAPLLQAITGQQAYDRTLLPMVLVGLSYGGLAPDYGQLRNRDFKPRDKARGAAELYRYLIKTLRPAIEQQYRVDPQAAGLGGSSLGGLFTLYALYQDPTAFSRYIAVSPAAVWEAGSLANFDEAYAKRQQRLPAVVYISHGANEYAPFRDPIIAFKQQLSERDYQDLDLRLDETPELRHSGVKAIAYAVGLAWAWRGLAPDEPSGLAQEMGAGMPD